MRTITQFFIIFFIIQFSVYSQQITEKVITNAGNSSENGNASISYTIGELLVNTIASPDSQLFITQGFHQPSISVESVNVKEKYGQVQIKAFPNPVADMLNVSISNYQVSSGIEIKIYDLQGKFYEIPCYFNETGNVLNISIEFKTILSGEYYIILLEKETSEIISELKILKIK